MAYNSNSFHLTATGSLNLPSKTFSILLRCPYSNSANVSVRLGGGSPMLIHPGESVGISLGEIMLGYELIGATAPATIFISTLSATIAPNDALDVDIMEWRTA